MADRNSVYLQKRSMRIAGHRTSIALEPEFWTAAERLARRRGVSLPMLAASIDEGKARGQSLASAMRVAALVEASAD
jgi:predicted DNA-binding ribbon-helix-helix protein